MTTFKEIRGTAIQSVSSDPSNPEAGQIWYNNTIGVLKGYQLVAGAWSAGGNINTSRSQLAGAGTQTAGLIFGGTPPNASFPSVTNGAKTEEYDGSAWTNVNNKNNSTRQQSGFGTQTAAVSFGGYRDTPGAYFNGTEEYDGTNWSNVNNYPTSISNGSGGGTGTLTAGLNAAGYNGTAYTNATSEYDGTNWTSGGTYPISAQNSTQFGTQTAAVGVGGLLDPSASNMTAHYDGTSWTAASNMLVTAIGNGRCGTQNDGIIYAGSLPASYSNSSYLYNGTSWTTNPASLSIGRAGGGPATSQGSSSGAFLAGGDVNENPTYTATEEFTGPTLGTKKITTS
jgi:hypothetical protein